MAPTLAVRGLLRQLSALSKSEFENLQRVVRDDTLARSLHRLAIEAGAFDDEGPTQLTALRFANPRREWFVMRIDGASTWTLTPPQSRGRGRISRVPSRKKLLPSYDRIRKNAAELRKQIRDLDEPMAAPKSIKDARVILRRIAAPPRWRTLDVVLDNDEFMVATQGRSLDVSLSDFFAGRFQPRHFGLHYLAAWLPGQPQPETVRAILFATN